MRHKNRRWLFVWAVMYSILGVLECELIKNSTKQATENATKFQEARPVFSPRMDYEQWTPIGRGDPLKNDPTYDYVPPILEHVHYWVDPSSRKPDPQLGLEGSKQEPGSSEEANQKTEILVLGVSSKKPSVAVQQPVADSRRDVYDPYFKYVENGAKFTQNHYQSQRERIYFPNPYYFPSSGYHKSKHDRYKGSGGGSGSAPQSQIPYTILMPPPLPRAEMNQLRTSTTESSASLQDVQLQSANLIHHSSTISNSIRDVRDEENYHAADSTSVTWRTPLVAPHQLNNNHNQNKRPPILPMSSSIRPETMYKMGKVENAHMDAMHSYVNIGKPEAHIQPEIQVAPPSNNLISLLKKEIAQKESQKHDAKPKIQELNPDIPSTMTSFLANIPKATTKSYTTTTTTPSSTTPTTTSPTLTTDPLFRHYKQPAEPLRGPMYLIIQGHSKVKTYGPAKQLFGINVQDLKDISKYDKDFPVKHLHSFRKKEEYHPITRTINARGRALDLSELTLTDLVHTGYGAIDEIDMTEEPQDIDTTTTTTTRTGEEDDIKETDLVAKFQVASEGTPKEEYHKGIVEEARVGKDDRKD